MKAIIATTLLSIFSISVFAQEEDDGPALTPMLLFDREGGGKQVFLEAATDKEIQYRENKVSQRFLVERITKFKSLFVYDPDMLVEIKDLYEGRKYQEALDTIKKFQVRYKPIAPLKNGPVAIANFLEIECLRKLGDLKALGKAVRAFDKSSLTRDTYQRQLQLNDFWDKVSNEEWNKLHQLAEEFTKTKLPSNQRAQVAYCHGLALEKIERPKDALLQYQIVMTADGGASEVIARDAALRALEILKNDPDVKEAKAAWDAEGESQPVVGTIGLQEAAGIAKLYGLCFSNGSALPAKYAYFLKYSVDAEAVEEDEKPKAEKDDKKEK